MRALVTGSAGFIGRHMTKALEEQGYTVHEVDIVDGHDCRDFFSEHSTNDDYDLVVHCAATVGGREGIDYKAALLGANNLQLDGALFEWALQAKPGRIVYFSSAASYPVELQNGPWADKGYRLREHEVDLDDRPGMPDNTYGWAKLTGEIIVPHVRKAGVPVTVVRPFSSYDWDQDDCYPFPEFVKRAKRRDDPFVVWGDGSQVRDFIHINDIVGAILELVRQEVDGPVNLGTGVATSMDDLARLCMRTVGYEAPIKHLEDKPIGVRHRVAVVDELNRYYVPKITLEEGVRRALAS